MKFVGMVIFGLMLLNFTGCYTVVYHSGDNYDSYSEPVYIPVLVPYPQPILILGPPTLPIYNDPPTEKIRHDDDDRNKIDDSYKERDPIRNQGGRGNGDRNTQGR